MKLLRSSAITVVAMLVSFSAAFADDAKPPRKDNSVKSAANSPASDTVPSVAVVSSDSQPTAAVPVVLVAPPANSPTPAPAAAPIPVPSSNPADLDEAPQPKWTPMPALDGNPGLFTLELGDTLPKHGFSIGFGANKFSRMPGDITSLQFVPSVGYGVNRWLSIFFQIDAQDHLHIGEPTLLSLSPANALNPQYQNTIYNSAIPSTGFPPAYVEDAPFASHNGTAVGEIDLGFKLGLLSERRGKPLSLSIRNDFYIPTATGYTNLLSNQVNYGKFNYGIGLEVSKTLFHRTITATANWSYRFMRDSSYTATIDGTTGIAVLNLADQMQVGAGFLVFPDKRFQIMTEYNSTIFIGRGIQNTTFGPRDPVDNVTGFRIYAWKWAALDVGYRYSLDLTSHRDRNGFVIKLGFAHWPEKPLPPDTLTSTCNVDKSSVMEGSGDFVTATSTGTDSNGHPLTYMWTATGGAIAGTGPYVRWDSNGVAAGNYVLTSRVDNGAGKSSSCSANVNIQPKPAPVAPTMSCAADRSTVLAGERAEITATVNDPSGTALTFAWQTNGGQIIGAGSMVQLDTSGLQPGTYTVTGRAENAVHSACDCTAVITVQAPAPPPRAGKVGGCDFARNSARADNICKRVLDDAAVRLQSDPKSKIVLVGYSDPKEAHAEKLAAQRADSGKKYLGDKPGVDGSRVDVRTAAGQAGAGDENRRVDVMFVPDGASF